MYIRQIQSFRTNYLALRDVFWETLIRFLLNLKAMQLEEMQRYYS